MNDKLFVIYPLINQNQIDINKIETFAHPQYQHLPIHHKLFYELSSIPFKKEGSV